MRCVASAATPHRGSSGAAQRHRPHIPNSTSSRAGAAEEQNRSRPRHRRSSASPGRDHAFDGCGRSRRHDAHGSPARRPGRGCREDASSFERESRGAAAAGWGYFVATRHPRKRSNPDASSVALAGRTRMVIDCAHRTEPRDDGRFSPHTLDAEKARQRARSARAAQRVRHACPKPTDRLRPALREVLRDSAQALGCPPATILACGAGARRRVRRPHRVERDGVHPVPRREKPRAGGMDRTQATPAGAAVTLRAVHTDRAQTHKEAVRWANSHATRCRGGGPRRLESSQPGGGGWADHWPHAGHRGGDGRPARSSCRSMKCPTEAWIATAAAIGAPAGRPMGNARRRLCEGGRDVQEALGAPIYGLMIGQNGRSSTMNAWLPVRLLGTKVIDAVGDIRAHPTGDMGSIGMASSPSRRSRPRSAVIAPAFLHRAGGARRDRESLAGPAQGGRHVGRLHRQLPQSGPRLLCQKNAALGGISTRACDLAKRSRRGAEGGRAVIDAICTTTSRYDLGERQGDRA